MKQLLTYINEALKSDVQQWLKNVYQTQQTLIKDNKVQPLQVDVNKLNKPKKSFTFEDFSTDAVVKKIVGVPRCYFLRVICRPSINHNNLVSKRFYAIKASSDYLGLVLCNHTYA